MAPPAHDPQASPGASPDSARRGGRRWRLELTPWRAIGLIVGVTVALTLALAPSPLQEIPGMGRRPACAAAVAALMAIWWFTEAIRIDLTACLPLVLYPLLGVFGRGFAGDLLRAIEPFVDAYIFLFLGGMAIGAAMEESHLHRRVALNIMRAVGTAPERLLLGMLVATAFVSLWLSNTATAVMMMPIAMALVSELEAARGGARLHHLGCALLLAVAYASNVGGIGTKIGTATNSIFAGFLAEKLHYDLTFTHYLAIGLPFVVLFIPLIWAMLWRVARRDALPATGGHAQDTAGAPGQTRDEGRVVLDRALAELGPMQRNERMVAAVFLVAATLWIAGDPLRQLVGPIIARGVGLVWPGFRFLSKHYEATVAMSAAASLIALRAVSWRALARIPWGTLLLLGGSFAMAAGIESSGLAAYLATWLGALAGLPLGLELLLTSLATVALSAVASNTATVNLMLNILPRSMPVLTVASIAASCDFALPAGTPPNAIVFGSGYIRLPTMMRIGVLLDLMAALLLAGYGYLYLTSLFS
jgi:sodium-dependent dicarboxylate transporter 2/3/5